MNKTKTNKKEKTAKNKCGFDRNDKCLSNLNKLCTQKFINFSGCKAGLAEWSMRQSEKLERCPISCGFEISDESPTPGARSELGV